jgi:hypothetical protein
MAPTLYPRGTVKRIVKAHSQRPLSKNVDILVRYVFKRRERKWVSGANAILSQIYLNYALFMQEYVCFHSRPIHDMRACLSTEGYHGWIWMDEGVRARDKHERGKGM